MNDFEFTQHAKQLAKEIVKACADHDAMSDMAYDYADGSEYVVYTGKAYDVCLNCNTAQGEELLTYCEPSEASCDSMVRTVVYGELVARIESAIDEILEGDY